MLEMKKIRCITVSLFIFIAMSQCAGDESTIFINNRIENCKSSEIFDVNFFACRECDPQLNLVPSKNGFQCTCNAKSIMTVEYDSNLRQPICTPRNCSNYIECNILPKPEPCSLGHLAEVISISPPSKSIQIQYMKINKSDSTNCTKPLECIDSKNYARFQNYCVPSYLMRDFLDYKQFKVTTTQPLAAANDIFSNLDFLMFFCQTMRMTLYCERVANLCVLSVYNLDKFSPCNSFYTIQTTFMGSNIDQSKVVPFLFYSKGRSVSDNLDKVIDFRYKFARNDMEEEDNENEMQHKNTVTSKISLMMVAHELNGDLSTIQQLKLSDLNLCPSTRQSIHFGENVGSACQIDLRSMIEMSEKRPPFLNVYLNYTENSLNLLKTVPVLIRNAFTYNMNPYDREKWQLVKRFFMVDIITGRNRTYQSPKYSADNYFDKYLHLRYVRRVELQFQLNENHYYYGNKISVPLLIIEYAYVDMLDYKYANNYDVDFEFKVTFKKTFLFGIFFHILFTIAIASAIGLAIFQTVSFKRRKQQADIDSLILVKFIVSLCSTMGTVLFGSAAILTIYIYFVYKTQYIVKALPPYSELKFIKFFFVLSFILKGVKFCHQLSQQVNCDIFFIDWERPRVFEHQITLKSTNNLDTPSICSSARQYQQNDGLSAWRTYFVANEWVKLATKRKCSIGIQILMVLLTIIVFRFDWPHFFSFKSVFHWPWTPNADHIIRNGRTLEMLSIGLIIYTICYVLQRAFNFLIYERYIQNSIKQFIDICSMSNISMLIFSIDSYGYYVHGRSPHGFADTDMCSMLQQLRRESENMCGHRGLLPNSEHQTFCFIAPLQLRVFYDKLKSTLQKSIEEKNGPQNYQHSAGLESMGKFYEQNLQQIASANTTINRFLSAFIDHGLKDLDYIIQEKSILEYIFDFEFDSNVTESRGTFYMDNGHSFDNVLFYGNEQLFFQIEIMLFITIIVISGNFLFAMLFVGIAHQATKHTVKMFVKMNLSKQTLIDEKFIV